MECGKDFNTEAQRHEGTEKYYLNRKGAENLEIRGRVWFISIKHQRPKNTVE